jgi:hypothetical protein
VQLLPQAGNHHSVLIRTDKRGGQVANGRNTVWVPATDVTVFESRMSTRTHSLTISNSCGVRQEMTQCARRCCRRRVHDGAAATQRTSLDATTAQSPEPVPSMTLSAQTTKVCSSHCCRSAKHALSKQSLHLSDTSRAISSLATASAASARMDLRCRSARSFMHCCASCCCCCCCEVPAA